MLREFLTGGDRRSIALGNQALAVVLADPERVGELALLTRDADWLVVMRAMDLLDKVAHRNPAWVQPHRAVFIGPLAAHESWEIRLQIARTLPLLSWTPAQRAKAVTILRGYVEDSQKFVKAWALDSLAQFAEDDPSLRPIVKRYLGAFERSGSAALKARARQIRGRMVAA